MDDLAGLFVSFCEGSLRALPWIDGPLSLETEAIRADLLWLNKHGYLTINSQPAVNGARSHDAIYGWGPEGGRVYQKAYVEFFVSAEQLGNLETELSAHPSLQFFAVNDSGVFRHNAKRNGANAVTWGVFPGREIVQPTIVEQQSFLAWKVEAFDLWRQWQSLYQPGSVSHSVLQTILDHWYLVNVVDNDYVEGCLLSVFRTCDSPSSSCSGEF